MKITKKHFILLSEIIQRFWDDERYSDVFNSIKEIPGLIKNKEEDSITVSRGIIPNLIKSHDPIYIINTFNILYDKLINVVIDSKDPIYNYRVAYEMNFDFKYLRRHEEVVLEAGKPRYNYLFAFNVPRANIKAHEQKVIESGDPECCYLFARFIKGADIKALEKAVLAARNPKWCYFFARYIPGADIKAHEYVVIKSKSAEFNIKFARDIPGARIKKHSDVILEYGTGRDNYTFANEIEDADIEEHISKLEVNDKVKEQIKTKIRIKKAMILK